MMEVVDDEELATLASSRLTLHASFPQQQPQRGVPGFPDFPTCWKGGEASSELPNSTTKKQTAMQDNDDNDKSDDIDYKEMERERTMILAEAKALKEAFLTQAKALKTASSRIPLRRRAVNKYGTTRKGFYGVDSGGGSIKPQAHKKNNSTRKKQGIVKRTEVESLRKSLMGMRVTLKYKSA